MVGKISERSSFTVYGNTNFIVMRDEINISVIGRKETE
jgi:hypothetical protein